MMMRMVKKQKQISSGSSSSSSRSNVVELPEDLILEICSHLHPASLLRFKSVSKKWYSLLSNPHFLVRHTLLLHHSPPLLIPHSSSSSSSSILLHRYFTDGNSRILILPPPPPPQGSHPPQNDEDEDEDEDEGDDIFRKLSPLLLQNLIDYRPEQDDVHEKGKFMLLDSCNGLLLYTNPLKYRIHEKHNWYVCNPITHDYIKLPTLYELEQEQGLKILSYLNHSNLVFQPSSLSLTFKVITWLRCRYNLEEEEEKYRLYVYSSETRSWRFSISINEFPYGKGVLCNGVLYWSHFSLCYDVDKDRISTLKFPNLPVGYIYRTLYYFGECGGRLRLIENYYKHSEQMNHILSIFDAMELNNEDQQQQQDNAELWTLKYRVNIGEEGYYGDLIRKYPSCYINILDLYKTKKKNAGGGGGEEEEEVMLLRISNVCIIPFNLSSNTFGKELWNGKNKPLMSARGSGFREVLRYNTITLFPPSSSLLEDKKRI